MRMWYHFGMGKIYDDNIVKPLRLAKPAAARVKAVEKAVVAIAKAERRQAASSELVPGRLAFVIRLPARLVKRLDLKAAAEHRSRNDLITAILEEGTPK